MAKGGARPGAGRKPKPKMPATVSKGTAQEILDFLALPANPHDRECRCLKCRWRELSQALDLRLRYHVEKSLLDRVVGLPPQSVNHQVDGEVEHTHRLERMPDEQLDDEIRKLSVAVGICIVPAAPAAPGKAKAASARAAR